MILCLGTTPTVQRAMVFKSFSLDSVNRALDTQQAASGKSVNVARVLTVLGEKSLALGFVGSDSGQYIRHDLSNASVPHDFVDVAPPTRTCTTIIDQSTGVVTELVEESKPVDPAAYAALTDKFEAHLPHANLLVLSGSLTPGADPTFYAHCIRRAHAHNIRTILDATGQPLRHALAARPFLVKPNRAELAATVDMTIDSDESLRAAMRKLLAAGPSWIIVTLGAQGALLSDGATFWKLTVPKVHAISPIGSGDSLTAGLAASLARRQTVPQALLLGAAAAVANTLTPMSGSVHIQDVHRLLPQIQVQQQ